MTDRHEKIKHYLDQLCSQVKAREVHTDLRDELGNHMEEMMLDKEQEGLSQEEAAAYAIEQMGDPAVVGKSMHRLHRHRMHWGLLVGLIGLSITSLLLIWIFTTNVADEKYQSLYRGHVVYTVIGVMMMLFFIYFDYRKLKRAAWCIYILLNVMLWISPMITTDIHGNSRYWGLFGLTIDLTTASVWILPLAIGAIMLDKLRSNCNMQSILTYIAMIMFPAVLLFQTLDWVRLFLFGIMSIILFGWLTKKWLYTVIGAVVTGSIFVLLLFFADQYGRLERLSVVLNLQDDPYGSGYSNNSIIEVIQSSGWWGNGIDTTFDKFKTSYYDYPGVLLIDVFGWSAGILLLVGIIWFVISMMKMLPRIRDDFGRMIIVSITAVFALQIIYSLAMTTGKAPILSISFPFIGYGNHLMFDYAMLGLLLGVYRRKDTHSKRNEKIRQKVDADPMTSS
ncbi:FtsW/RodA/SpoVE family cell cycle protein [Paenibacillus taichungensis]|uniref:FtsW/RodA/SpoVE family cell cycle protein n=1 Tax=Paenibacillus taichungensis TaxID=484184 RepID=UPI002DBD39F9|nr:FtsW/RodA/SpoVE family cell cycle protein [Paenibacillus taichungensis]MEC0106104.1 FtsW/RodA/SpoVE family cell cycle protein [Paenibacillus taichungensis]MEC0196793.1 FtsW/RodA/SpoVE family cell cycle protein [Paenibacillus taichungensis]